ncbi:MAG: AI-2E family transporter [Spirochaetales bacterium]|nr:AI-2E family transporter [Spirochaetales bacterium]
MTEDIRLIRSIRNILIVAMGVLLLTLLKTLSALLLPLVFAGLLALLCIPLVQKLRDFHIPKALILPVVALLVCFILVLVINIFVTTFSSILSDMDELSRLFNNKIGLISRWADRRFGLDLNENHNSLTNWFWEWIGGFQWSTALKDLALGVGDFGKDFLLFFLYFLFLLGGLTEYKSYIQYVVKGNDELKHHTETLQHSISSYIAIKTVISLITGVLAFFVCLIFGLNYALFWGFIAFLFNFIPSIGSILSTLLPLLMAFIQFDSVGQFTGLAVVLLGNQLIIGNVVDPMVMGDRMRINSITVIFGLVFWGYIWGIPGMLLSVPLNVIMKLGLEQSESLSIFARIMGSADNSQEKTKSSIFTKKRHKKNVSQ